MESLIATSVPELKDPENNPFKPTGIAPISLLTVRGYYRTLKAFFNWMVFEDILQSNPLAKVKMPKAPVVEIIPFSPSQVQTLLRSIDTGTSTGQRDYTILLLLYDTGIRAGELLGLTIENVHFDEARILVTGKGNKQRFVPVGKSALAALWKLIHVHRPEPASCQVSEVFLSRDGFPLRERTLQQMVFRRCQTAGITGVRSSPHTFRHSFALRYLQGNGEQRGDVLSLQKVLGHTSLAMVRNYANLTDSDIQAVHRLVSPGDGLRLPRNRRAVSARS